MGFCPLRHPGGYAAGAAVCALALLLNSAPASGAVPENVLAVRGIGAEGHTPYQGGKVEFLDVALADELVHLPEGGRVPLRLSIRYRVVEAAPVLLNSRMGTEYWRVYQFGRDATSALYTREEIDLRRTGEAEARATEAEVAPRYGTPLQKGVAGIVGHSYFLIDQPSGQWLDVVPAPPFFSQSALTRRLTFTLANLHHFSLTFDAVESTWTPGGPIRVRLVVTDADGERFPVLPRGARLRAGSWSAPLSVEWGPLLEPTGWLVTTLPARSLPAAVVAEAVVSAVTPEGARQVPVSKGFRAG
ncbi:MAG: hypothetical protein QHJ73_19300, partial [Armatimonadota bacterium]|nr:hypothetical protein [Armatimonadota bacterium]